MTSVLKRERRGEDRHRGEGWRQSRRLELGTNKPRDIWSHWPLEEARKDYSLEALEEVQLCWHLDLELLASRTVRKINFRVLSLQVCSIFYRTPREVANPLSHFHSNWALLATESLWGSKVMEPLVVVFEFTLWFYLWSSGMEGTNVFTDL